MQYDGGVEKPVLFALCLLGALGAAPLTLNIQNGGPLRLTLRYLWLRLGISPALRRRLRSVALSVARSALRSRDFSRIPALCAPLLRRPLALRRFRLSLAFSTGDAAETALLHGGLCLVAHSLSRLPRGERQEITLSPCFASQAGLALGCDIALSLPAAVFLCRIIALVIRGKRMLYV
jgi:hypothetical protein